MRTVGRTVTAVAALGVLAAGCGGDSSGSGSADTPITVDDAWARATVPAATTGAVYLELVATDGDELVGAVVGDDVAAEAALHQHVPAGGGDDGDHEGHGDTAMVTMTALDRLALPAGERVRLEPGGTHLMLVDLARPLTERGTFDVTLRFATADDVTVTVTVRE